MAFSRACAAVEDGAQQENDEAKVPSCIPLVVYTPSGTLEGRSTGQKVIIVVTFGPKKNTVLPAPWDGS